MSAPQSPRYLARLVDVLGDEAVRLILLAGADAVRDGRCAGLGPSHAEEVYRLAMSDAERSCYPHRVTRGTP